jgi:hypothetical protein
MPTIEIVSLRARAIPVEQEKFGFAVWQESEPISHRSLFFDYLRRHSGAILHLGNPAFSPGTGGFHAGALIDWGWESPEPDEIPGPSGPENAWANQHFGFRFRPEFRSELERLLHVALDASPERRVFFLTDYQFGPEKPAFEPALSPADFWQAHDSKGLSLNTLYDLSDISGSPGQ